MWSVVVLFLSCNGWCCSCRVCVCDLFLFFSFYRAVARSRCCSSHSINQSKILTEPHTGKEKPVPALPQVGLDKILFVYGLLCTNQYYSLRTHSLFRHPTPPSHRPHYCAMQWVPPEPPLLKYLPHNIGNDNIV